MPAASKAAWKITGLSEWPNGWPMTPARFVFDITFLALWPARVDLADVLAVLLQRCGEDVAAVRPRHEEQVVRIGWVRRSKQRVQPRVGDGPRRQPWVP